MVALPGSRFLHFLERRATSSISTSAVGSVKKIWNLSAATVLLFGLAPIRAQSQILNASDYFHKCRPNSITIDPTLLPSGPISIARVELVDISIKEGRIDRSNRHPQTLPHIYSFTVRVVEPVHSDDEREAKFVVMTGVPWDHPQRSEFSALKPSERFYIAYDYTAPQPFGGGGERQRQMVPSNSRAPQRGDCL